MSSGLLNSLIALVSLAFIARLLYLPKVQESSAFKAMVVPLANIMDVGFIVLAPIIVVLVGFDAPLVMLAICLLAIATGFAISYNIRNYEPLIGKPDKLHRVNSWATWALVAASVVNIAYYAQLLMTLVLLPLGDLYSPGLATATSAVVLGVLAFWGFRWGLAALNRIGNRTTAFNLAALAAVLIAFAAFNIQLLVGGDFDLPSFDTSNDSETFRKLLGFFAMVQGFEAARYMGAYFAAEERVSTMRAAQYIATMVFVLLIALTLVLFAGVEAPADGTAIFVISEEVSAFLPFLILTAALGSQLSAIVNSAHSRSEMIIGEIGDRLPQKYTFPLVLVPAIAVVLLTDVTSAVALASRVFAGYFLIQALIAGRLAARSGERGWVAFFIGVGIAMAIVMVLGIPT